MMRELSQKIPKLRLKVKIPKIMVAILIAAIVYFLGTAVVEQKQAILLGIVALMITLWTNEGLSMGVVALFPLILFPAFGILEFDSAAPQYASPIIFLFIGGFLLAIAVQKTGLHEVIAKKLLYVFPSTERGVIFALAITAAFMSSLLSNTTITLMLLPVALFLTTKLELKKRFLLAVAYGASIGGILTPIGTPPNLIFLGFMESQGLNTPTFLQWILLMLPLVALMLIIVPFIISFGLKKTPIPKTNKPPVPMTKEQKKLGWVLVALVLLLVLNSPIKPFYPGLGINEKMILLGFGLLMFFPGFGYLKWEDVSKLPFQIIFLFGAGFTIAEAFTSSGIIEPITQSLFGLAGLPLILIILIMAFVVSFTTEVTSNTALIAMVLPIFYAFISETSIGGLYLLLVPTIAASYAFMLPIATPPNAIVMSSDELKIKDMAKIGVFINLVGIFLLTLVAFIFWKVFAVF